MIKIFFLKRLHYKKGISLSKENHYELLKYLYINKSQINIFDFELTYYSTKNNNNII